MRPVCGQVPLPQEPEPLPEPLVLPLGQGPVAVAVAPPPVAALLAVAADLGDEAPEERWENKL